MHKTEPSYRFYRSLATCILVLLAIAPAANAEKPIVRFGIVTFYNPRVMVMRYQPFMDALSQRTPYTFELVLAPDYHQTVTQLENGEIDIAYLGPVTFLQARRSFNAIPLVRLNTDGKKGYHSVVCVRDESDIKSVFDLKNKRFAYGSPLSTSGYLYPRKILTKNGLKPSDFKSLEYFYHHDSAMRAVLTGKADACGVRDLTAERYASSGIRVIAKSDAIPNFPLVVNPQLPDTLVNILRTTLLELNPESPEDSAAMSLWDEELREGFSSVLPNDYSEVESLLLEIFKTEAWPDSLEALIPDNRDGQ